MVNGNAPKVVVVFGPNGEMQMQSSLNPQQMALAVQLMQMWLQDALRPKNPLLVPLTKLPPDLRGDGG